jgi:hypothetical protein
MKIRASLQCTNCLMNYSPVYIQFLNLHLYLVCSLASHSFYRIVIKILISLDECRDFVIVVGARATEMNIQTRQQQQQKEEEIKK